jgi:hypothetical protein
MHLHVLCIAVASAFVTYSAEAQNDSAKKQNQNVMKDFSLVVRVPITYTTEQARAVGPQWDNLLAKWKQENIYVISFAFPGESRVVTGVEKTLSTGPVVSDGLRVVSNIVLRVPTLEDAIAQSKECPILSYGGSVEIREIPAGLKLPAQ